MKNLFSIVSATSLILLIISCVHETNTEYIAEYTHHYELSFDSLSKTVISDNGTNRSPNWSNGDEIKYYTESNQTNPEVASVALSGDKAYITVPRGRTDEFINAVYGASLLKSDSSTDNCMYVCSPVKCNQRYTSFAEAHVCAAFSDDIEDSNLRFHNAACIVHFTSTADVYKVVFSGNNGEIINAGNDGDLKITYGNGRLLSVESAATGSNTTNQTTVLIATNGVASDFYISILPVNFFMGVKIDCFDADGDLIVSKKSSNALKTMSDDGTIKLLELGKAQDWIDNAPPQAIDLGLSVKWASYNVGASKPEEFGDYFAWGETSIKNEYIWDNYQFGTGKNGPFSKYVLNSQYGVIDHRIILDFEDDAANKNWCGDWRMPSKEEFAELMCDENCVWTWTTKNGVNGYKITSRKNGYTENSIFLPANGMRTGSDIRDTGSVGNYWSSSVSEDGTYFSISPYFNKTSIKSDNCYRYFGLGIRSVYGAVVPITNASLPNSLTLRIGQKVRIPFSLLPDNATYKNVSWSSSSESIAIVDSSGTVTAITPGNTTITVYSANGEALASCFVSVIEKQMPIMSSTTKYVVGEVPELSGLCLTSDGKALWTVGDNGWLGQISFDGKVTKLWSQSHDLEGVTIHPETGDLYIACEPNSVVRIKAPEYAKPTTWDTVITVPDANSYGNSGMEGISYYKDDILFVGTQTGANVWLYTIDGKLMVRRDGKIVEYKEGDSGPRYVSLQKVYDGIKEVGGLCYDPVNDWLWVSDSERAALFVFDAELTHLLATYKVPDIHNAESVCVDHKNSCVWVGLDDDNTCCIYKIAFTGLN